MPSTSPLPVSDEANDAAVASRRKSCSKRPKKPKDTQEGKANDVTETVIVQPAKKEEVDVDQLGANLSAENPSEQAGTTGVNIPKDKSAKADVSCMYGIEWKNLTYTPGRKLCGNGDEEPRKILDGVSGVALPGEVVAIMGPSGSGKTTLLDILADRVGHGSVEGEINVLGGSSAPDGETISKRSIRDVAAYVSQEDTLLGSFSVEMTLLFSAGLSMPWAGVSERQDRVDEVLQLMGLVSCRGTLVGDVLRKGISGGQKRRLSIAIELLAAPAVMFLDECTSGLDSASTVGVVAHLRTLAQRGHTIVMTIHQPSARIVSMFSKMILLTGGRMAYCGSADGALEYFEMLGKPCPNYMNPSEHYLHLISQDFGDSTPEEITAICDTWTQGLCIGDKCQNGGCFDSDDAILTVTELRDRPDSSKCSRTRDTNCVWRWFRQLYFLSKRALFNNVLNPAIFIVRLVMYIMLSIMVGTMYITNDEISDKVVMLFYVQAFLVFMSVAILPFFEEMKLVFIRERANGQVTAAPFVVASLSCSLPMLLIIALCSTVIIVPLGGLNGGVMFCVNLFLSLVVAESMMHVIGALQPHFVIGLAVGAGLFGMFMLCEGFMVPRNRIPGWWIWAHYSAFHTYSFQAFMHNEFSGGAVGSVEYQTLDSFDIPHDLSQGRNMGILVAFAILMEIIFGFVLHFLHTGRR